MNNIVSQWQELCQKNGREAVRAAFAHAENYWRSEASRGNRFLYGLGLTSGIHCMIMGAFVANDIERIAAYEEFERLKEEFLDRCSDLAPVSPESAA